MKVKSRKRDRQNKKRLFKSGSCLDCSHCLPIGEGDFYCDEVKELVICEYDPSDYFMECKGKKYEKI